MDIELVVAEYLADKTGMQVYLEKPATDAKNAPDEYLVVEQIGGGYDIFTPVLIDIDCYAPKKQRKKAKATANVVASVLLGIDELANLYSPSVTNMYRQNDADTGEARYIVQIQIYVCN